MFPYCVSDGFGDSGRNGMSSYTVYVHTPEETYASSHALSTHHTQPVHTIAHVVKGWMDEDLDRSVAMMGEGEVEKGDKQDRRRELMESVTTHSHACTHTHRKTYH